MEQLGNIGSEVGRAANWQGRDEKLFNGAVDRALELFDLTLADPRWIEKKRLKEIGIAKDVFADGVHGGHDYNTNLKDLEKYFYPFALAARANIQS
ncbi:TPA: hypothetical protein DCZ32_04040 [Candidatus Uhrbacteria bacterium]|nr:hypothetical protein [Candidatus Uhrbacteria bacterium]